METDLEFFERLMKEKALQDMLKEKVNDNKTIELLASNDKLEEVRRKKTKLNP